MAEVTTGSVVRPFSGTGVPTDGTSGTFADRAPLGALYIDETNGRVYRNTNTLASPTWLTSDGVMTTEAEVDAHITASMIDADRLKPASLVGTQAAVVADVNVIGGILVIHRIAVADATANTDVVLTHKTRVIGGWFVKTAANGGAGDQFILENGTGGNAIVTAQSTNVADTVRADFSVISDAFHEVAAAGTLRVNATSATNCACVVYVLGVRVA